MQNQCTPYKVRVHKISDDFISYTLYFRLQVFETFDEFEVTSECPTIIKEEFFERYKDVIEVDNPL